MARTSISVVVGIWYDYLQKPLVCRISISSASISTGIRIGINISIAIRVFISILFISAQTQSHNTHTGAKLTKQPPPVGTTDTNLCGNSSGTMN
jgi:hypothetical protein